MEFGDSGSMATTQKWCSNVIVEELPVDARVISRQGADWILFIERKDNLGKKRGYLRLTPAAKNVGEVKRAIRVRDTITVLEEEYLKLDEGTVAEKVDFNLKPHRQVLSYEIAGYEQQVDHCELVAVADVTDHYVVVVGTSFGIPTAGIFFRAPEDGRNFTVGQFLMANCYPCEPGVARFWNEEPVTHKKFYYYTQYFANKERSDPVFIAGEIRQLTEEEEDWVKNRLRSKEEITVDDALIYIRDPHIAAFVLEDYLQHVAVLDVTVEMPVGNICIRRDGKNNICVLEFLLSAEQHEQCVMSNSQYVWRTSSDLTVQHEDLCSGMRMEPAYVRYHNSKLQLDGSYLVELLTEERSAKLMRMVMDKPEVFTKKDWRVGPRCGQFDCVATAIREGFLDFFERTEIFNQFAGRTEKSGTADIPNKDAPFHVKGTPLDPHQLSFMKESAHNPGWTCAQAPPGCGKTHTTSALVAYLNEMEVKGGVCISGTTNSAVTNAADAVKENFPGINIIRNYSTKAEFEITKKSEAISLKIMAQNCGDHLDRSEAARVFKAKRAHDRSVRLYDTANFDKVKQQANAFGKVQQTEKVLKGEFISHYEMKVYATTIELLIRGGDKFASGVVRGSEDYQEKAIKRLILDEAAQLSPTEALALYCRLPELTHITLLGDSYQLGPHSRIEPGTDVHQFKTEGELTRMYKLPSTAKMSLNGLYRCHPLISQKVLIPIYGDMMEPRVTAAQRNLAAVKGLPMARDGSPVVFFNTQGKEEKCSNRSEANAVSSFVVDLVAPQNGNGVEPEDITILVFHRQQKILLQEMLGDRKRLKSLIRIETVDSFQGKESKIVILCTTKSAIGDKTGEKLKFIAAPQRATVALSRAQHALYVFGDLVLLARSKFYAKIMATLLNQRGFMDQYLNPLKNDHMTRIRRTINGTLGVTQDDLLKANEEGKVKRAERRAEWEKKKAEKKKNREMEALSSAVKEVVAPGEEEGSSLASEAKDNGASAVLGEDLPAEGAEGMADSDVEDQKLVVDFEYGAETVEKVADEEKITVEMEKLEEKLTGLTVEAEEKKEGDGAVLEKETEVVEKKGKNGKAPEMKKKAEISEKMGRSSRNPRKSKQVFEAEYFLQSGEASICPVVPTGVVLPPAPTPRGLLPSLLDSENPESPVFERDLIDL